MARDTRGCWNDIWLAMDDSFAGPDDLLVTEVVGLSPGKALEIGCGTGSNAVWLAQQRWQVTAVDYSDVAITKARKLAKERAVHLKFVVADASVYRPEGQYDLITSFYIQLPPDQRARILSYAQDALAPGGTLLFVSHDKSSPPSGWTDEDLLTLTTPEEIVAEIPTLTVEKAVVLEHDGRSHSARPGDPEGEQDSRGDDMDESHDPDDHRSHEQRGAYGSGSTVVRAVRPVAG